ncbi:hypothetical protein AB833_12275 [Chromatiales bacterium (ex Bugula neritina AB1)]|nr:hypothetical protein AB833_12275 [Chromatiales bacterium (ex Bugula neritina AB1)]
MFMPLIIRDRNSSFSPGTFTDSLRENTSVLVMSLGILAVSGCGGDSNTIGFSGPAVQGQAIDGYIVGADFFCDGILTGKTEASGVFTCPDSTRLVEIRGGTDVGFNDSAIGGGAVFNGELKAPGGAPFVTPLSTIATNMATIDGMFDIDAYDEAEVALAHTLLMEELNLEENPRSNIELAKVNKQINNLVSGLAADFRDYSEVSLRLAEVLANSPQVDLTNDPGALVGDLNEKLIVEAPDLALSAEDQVEVIEELRLVNSEVGDADTHGEIDVAAEPITGTAIDDHALFNITPSEPGREILDQSNTPDMGPLLGENVNPPPFPVSHPPPAPGGPDIPAVTALDRDIFIHKAADLVRFVGPSSLNTFANMYDFENATRYDYGYKVHSLSDTRRVEFSTRAFNIRNTYIDYPVNVAVEFTSAVRDDLRSMSVTMKNARLSMQAGDGRSVRITVPDDAVLNARAMDIYGVATNISTRAGQNYFASSEDGIFSFAMNSLEDELAARGYHNFTSESGHYKMTLIIEGLNFGLVSDANTLIPALHYSISTSEETVTGNGIQGYFTTD